MNWFYRLLNRLGLRDDALICMCQEDTFCWPDHLGERTAGKCSLCGRPIYYEKQNGYFGRKICNRCEFGLNQRL
jgi:hypothetical protein